LPPNTILGPASVNPQRDLFLRYCCSVFGWITRAWLSVPNYTSYDAAIYQEHWAAYDVPRHLYHFSPQSMALLAKQHGFTITAHKPMWFDSFYVAMLSEQYKNGKGNLINVVWTGLLSNLNALADRKKCSSVIYILTPRPPLHGVEGRCGDYAEGVKFFLSNCSLKATLAVR